MTFLNPVVLLGLAAASIPLILHLLNLRKLRTIEFSSLRFLKELQLTKIRRLKLRQIILLVIRTLIIIFIVLTFARPTLRGPLFGAVGSRAHSTIVIILDNTFSMSAADDHGERFKQAKDAALNITKMLRDGDEAFLIRLSEIPDVTVDPATHEIEFLSTVINESAVSAVHRSLGDALLTAGKLLEQSINANKEIYIITDLQQSQIGKDTDDGNPAGSFSPQTHLYLVPIGAESVPNVSIDSLSVISTIIEKDKPASLSVSVRNWSETPIKNYVLNSYLNGKKSAQNSIDVDPWAGNSLEIPVTPQQTGILSGYVELEDDAIDTDNRRYFTISVPEEIKIALLARSEGDARFIRSALEARSGLNGSVIRIENVPVSKIEYFNFNSADILIGVNVPSFNSAVCARLREYVSRGGGLIIFPGADIDIGNYNDELCSKLGIGNIEKITGSETQPANLVFRSVDLDHPLFSGIFEKSARPGKPDETPVESPKIIKALSRKGDKKSHTIIQMSDGSPALSEHDLGLGKILFFSLAPSLDWSDFPIKGIFAPLIHRSVLYASPREAVNASLIAGGETILPVPVGRGVRAQSGDSQSGSYKILAPDSIEEIIQVMTPDEEKDKSGRGIFLPIRSLRLPGIYEIHRGGEPFALLAVNTYPPESDPRIAEEDEFLEFTGYHGLEPSNVHTIAEGKEISASILQFRYGAELWSYCVIIAIFLALIEIIIARNNKERPLE